MTRSILALALAGCTYISGKELEEKEDSLDEDGDGSPFEADCDDEDPRRSPAFAEAPYDGVDNDCLFDGDVIDADGDGYPGILAEDYAALEPEEEYPPGLVGKPLDCADDPVARPEAASIYPGSPAEVPYDGLDSDCARDNDFDEDVDGYLASSVPDAAAAFEAYVAAWGYDELRQTAGPGGVGAPLEGDCQDFDPVVHPNPGAPDAWYDGVDLDCDGANDFDQDGDGWMPPTVPGGDTEPLYNAFVAAFHQNDPPWTLPADVTTPDGQVLGAFDDCLDGPAALLPQVSPAEVHPADAAAPDPLYDGVDANCWADNDFDADLDGFVIDVLPDDPYADAAQAYADYVVAWGYEDREAVWGAPALLDAPGTGDCADDDPATYPAALEYIGDGFDQDCDGSADAARFTFAGWTWTNPSRPRVTRLGDTYVWAVTASTVDLSTAVLEEVGLALSVPLSAASIGALPGVTQFRLADPMQPIDEVLDLWPVPNDEDLSGDGADDPAAWVGVSFDAINGYTYLRGARLYEDSATGSLAVEAVGVSNFRTISYDPTSLTVEVNNAGEPYFAACTDDLLHAIQGEQAPPTEPVLEDETANAGGLCFFTTAPYALYTDEVVEYTRCSPTRCQEFTLTRTGDLLTATPGAITGELWTDVTTHGDLQILLDADSAVLRDRTTGIDQLLFPGREVVSADAMYRGPQLFAVAAVDEGAAGVNLYLQFGVPPALNELPLPFAADLPEAVPAEVALHVDEDRVLVVVTARDPEGDELEDLVGWTFLGTP